MKIPEVLRLSLLAFAEHIMADRPADFTVGSYMERWRLGPYGDKPNIYLHRFRGDDEDRAAHDHPYDNTSVILKSGYCEWLHDEPLQVVNGKYAMSATLWLPGDVITRKADHFHRLSIIDGKEAITLFIPGPRLRRWGFLTPGGWVDWEEFGK